MNEVRGLGRVEQGDHQPDQAEATNWLVRKAQAQIRARAHAQHDAPGKPRQ
jgi:hypothetical protein